MIIIRFGRAVEIEIVRVHSRRVLRDVPEEAQA